MIDDRVARYRAEAARARAQALVTFDSEARRTLGRVAEQYDKLVEIATRDGGGMGLTARPTTTGKSTNS